jgi:hypothetical protein
MRRERARNDLLTGLGLLTAAALVFAVFTGSPRAGGGVIDTGAAPVAAQGERAPGAPGSVAVARRD